MRPKISCRRNDFGKPGESPRQVLDWNEPAIGFYRSIGAIPMSEWTVQRVSGDALIGLAARASQRTPADATRRSGEQRDRLPAGAGDDGRNR
jgi:hypothetical protein